MRLHECVESGGGGGGGGAETKGGRRMESPVTGGSAEHKDKQEGGASWARIPPACVASN